MNIEITFLYSHVYALKYKICSSSSNWHISFKEVSIRNSSNCLLEIIDDPARKY